MNKFLQSPLLTALLVILAGFLILKVIEIAPDKNRLDSQVSNLENQIEEVKDTTEDLGQKSDYYQSDYYKEIQARLKLDYKRPGEKVIFVYENPGDVESGNREPAKDVPNWRKWLEYLGFTI